MFFQNSVIKKYLAVQEAEQVTKAWEIYKAYFLNPAIQENISASKEEQFQEGFLRELFVKVFGYTLNPSLNFNLITEQKNETDAKKADGAILRDGKVIGVIELKDHKTTDLNHVERQAFGYKSQHKDTKYVVISNFEKLRFYIDNAVEHIEWNLFTLTEEQFRLLYFCLAWANIHVDSPIKAKAESVSNEDEITQQLYKDYSAFKREIFANILAHNTDENTPKEQILLLFKKTQKLLDRLLFIFFAEDSGLLPPNSMVEILNQWEKLIEMDEYRPLYDRIKKYFGYMNTGFQGKKYEIFAYNGGLFKPDEILDNLTISDDLLARFTRKLADYDYCTDVDVNILGHIFENSLNEIEEVTAQINAGEKPSVSKRKRDGVFYTPQYITKYIIENTVSKLCAEKKASMGIDEQEYFADKNRQTATKKRLLDQLSAYREWLLGITICDPACGSGAFLNAALQFLMAEHKLIDEMEAKLTGSTIEFPGVENSILENNLYGVDINEESVEIARLALWLRTAKPHRKLSSLNNNIKCGNSLISDPEIAGDKAFNWQEEFPQVFEKGGFDVVIGNPPYVKVQTMSKSQADYYSKEYNECAEGNLDLYLLFLYKGSLLLRKDGLLGFILPNKFFTAENGNKIRNYLNIHKLVYEIDDFTTNQIFDGATTYTTLIFLKAQSETFKYRRFKLKEDTKVIENKNYSVFPESELSMSTWTFMTPEISAIIDKIRKQPNNLESITEKISKGSSTGNDKIFLVDLLQEEGPISTVKTDNGNIVQIEKALLRPFVYGEDVKRYIIARTTRFLIFPYHSNSLGVKELIPLQTMSAMYPLGYNYLLENKKDLMMRKVALTEDTFYKYSAARNLNEYENTKILIPDMLVKNRIAYDIVGDIFHGPAIHNLVFNEKVKNINEKVFLAILNSSLFWFFIKNTSTALSGDAYRLTPEYVGPFGIPNIPDQQPFINLADKMLSLNRDLQAKRARFIRRLQDNMPDIKITGTLETFDTLDFAGFVSELKKQKIKLSLVQQDEWEEYFNQYKTDCEELKSSIAATDAEINNRVYALYGLTDDEIQLIEQ